MKTRRASGREQNHPVATPRGRCPCRGACQRLDGRPTKVHALQRPVGDEADAAAVRRPERQQCTFRSWNLLRLLRVQRANEQSRTAVGTARDECQALAVGRQRETRRRRDRKHAGPFGQHHRHTKLPVARRCGSRQPPHRAGHHGEQSGSNGDKSASSNGETRGPAGVGGNPLELTCQVRGALPAVVGILRQAAPNHAIECAVRGRALTCHRRRIVLEDGADESRAALRFERLPPGQRLVQHRTKGKDVGARVRRPPLQLLRRHVLEGALNRAFGRNLRRFCQRRCKRGNSGRRRHVLGQAEVEQLGARLGDHHVAGLEIAMDQTVTMCRSQRVGDVDGEPQCLRRRQRARRNRDDSVSPSTCSSTRKSTDRRRRGVVPPGRTALTPDVVQRADMRMAEGGDRLGLAFEAASQPRVARVSARENLDGYGPIQARVGRQVHLAHTARAEHALDPIRPQPAARRKVGTVVEQIGRGFDDRRVQWARNLVLCE